MPRAGRIFQTTEFTPSGTPMTTPNDQNFDGFPNDNQAAGVLGPRTLGSFVVEGHRTDPGGGGDLSTVLYDAVAIGVSIGSGKMLGLNYGAIYTADWWQFRSVSAADNFKLASLAIESSSYGWDDVITVSGYNDSGLAVSATVDLNFSGTYGSISYVKLGGAVGGTLTFGAGWGNVDTVRFAGQAGDPYGTQLWIDNIDVSAAAAITSAAYNAASGVLTVTASGVSAGESITAAKLTLTGQDGNSYALTSGAVIAGAGSFSISLNAADKLAVNGLLNKNLGAADDGTSFNLAGAAGWNSSSGAEVDGSSPVSVSNVTTPSISSATYNAATHVLSVTGANLVGTIGAANDVTVAKLTLTGEGGVAYTLTGASVDVASASGFALTLSGADRDQVEMMFNRNGTLATDASTAYNLSAADNWNTSFTGGNTAIATTGVTVSNVATPAISSASYDAASGTLVVAGSALTHAAGAANDIVANKVTFTGQGGATYTLTDTANAEITSGTGFTLVLSAADRGAVNLLLNKNGAQSNGGTAYNLAMGEDWAAGAAAGVVVADVSGNAVTVSNVVADTTPPTASLALSDTALRIGDTALVTITFSEAVTGFTNADLAVANGTLGAVTSSDGGVTWSATFTPTAGVTDAINVVVLDKTGVSDAAGNAGVGTASSANYAIDTAAPTTAIVLSDSALAAGESATVTITFSEAVTGLTLACLNAGSGTLGGLSSLDGGVTWSATFTPSAAATSGSNVITLAANSLFDLAGNANAAATSSANYVVDTQRPTASVTLSDSALKIGETSTVTIAFSEAVSGFSNADLTVANGVLAPVSSADGGVTWTATFTPDAGVTAASNTVTLDMTGVADGAGNAGAGATSSASYAIDTARPTATVAISDNALSIGETATVTITFSEAVGGFTSADLTVENGTIGALGSADGGVTWSAVFTPAAGMTDATNLITLDNTGVSDIAGNAGAGTSGTLNYAIDTAAPTAAIVLSDSALVAGESAIVTITFSEAITGLTLSDLSAGAGSLSALSSPDGGVTWSATLTPSAATASATNVIALAANSLTDLAGNANAAATSSANYTVDTRLASSTVTLSDSALKAGEASVVTIAFSEAVSGFSNADLTVANGVLAPVSSADGGVTWTAIFTPNAGITSATNTITLDNSGVTTAAGNAGIGVTSSANYAIDTLRPTATIALDDSALKIGDAATVTITFSEAVSGFTSADLTVANGTLGALSSSDGGVTWRAAFTPTAGITDADNVITVDTNGVVDVAGNTGAAAISSANYVIDTAAPTAAIVLFDSALIAGESATVTITFSEAVSGLTLADLSAGAGTLGGLASLDGGVTWTATLTPSAAAASATNAVTLSAGAVTDLAYNVNAGLASSANYTVDTVRPSATVTLSDSALKAGQTSTVSIVFSQAVSGFSNADLAVANGVLAPVSSADGGVTWTATFTPDPGITSATNIITLDNSGVTTAAGNAGIGITSSASYAIDTLRPTAAIALDDSALKIGDAATVTITFSEAVSGFTSADLTVSNGTLGALSSSDGGVTWRAAFTPAAGISDATNVIIVDTNGVIDAAGNAGAAAISSANYAIDTAAPTAAIVLSDSALIAGESATVTIAFSEAVSGMALGDLSAGAGTLSGLASLDGGITWTAVLTPSAATASATNLVTLAGASIVDLAGNQNAGAASSASYSVQTVRPTASITLSDSALRLGETSIVTIAFSEAVSGLTNADLTVANGTLAPVTSADGGITWRATFAPNAGITAAASAITLNNSGVTNGAGNAGSGTSSASYAIDTVRPSATIALSDRTLTMGETATVTITFSEAVSGFTNADLVVEHGTLGVLGSSDGGVTWRATLTPDAATRAAGAIKLATSGVADLAGNAGDTQAVSAIYSIDTRILTDKRDANIDGAPSTSVTVIDPATGLAMVELTVPMIAAFDPAPLLGKPGVADIPLGIAPAGLVVRLPVGAGLVAEGPATLLPYAQASTDLISRINNTTDAGSAEQQEMRARAHGFLDGLAAGTLLETRTLTLMSGTSFPAGQPIEIVGGAAGGTALTGLVIDTGALRPDIVLQLDNVEFAAIVGAATVRGGAGRNQLIGNHAAQNFSLGDGDDFGAGGGGSDLLAGGGGNDLLQGGTGDDVLQGGRSDRGDWTFVINADGKLVGRHALAAFQPGATENVAAAELNQGAAGLGFVGAKSGQLVELALLYDAAFARAPDLGGLEFYARDYTTAGAVMKSFFGSSEWLAASNAGLSDSAFLEKMYQQVLHRGPDKPGFAFWLNALAGKDGPPMTRQAFLTEFALSAEHRAMLVAGGDMVVGVGAQAREGDWFAHSGDDRLAGGAGNDVIVGGDGIDTLVYSGKVDDYRFLLGRDGQLRVEDKASGGLDTISGIEKGEFSDGAIGLSFTQADPKLLQSVGLMYQVVLDRAADAGGFAFWLGSHDTSTHMAGMFLESAEFTRHYGKLDDAQFVATLLANSGVASTGSVAAGWETWLGAHSRAELVVALIGDPAVTGAQFGAQGLWLV